MSHIQKLLEFIRDKNLAQTILDRKGKKDEETGEQILRRLGMQVVKDEERDRDSMSDWSATVEEGERIAKQETAAKSQPWQGASNFKAPAILSAAISFGDRAKTEILRGRNLLKSDIIGRDADKSKKRRSERVVEHMNYQINHEMDWRKTQEKLLYSLPSPGAVFKKTFFDPIEKVNKSELLHYPDFVINQACKSMRQCKTFTQPMDFDRNEIFERKQAGIWADVVLHPERKQNSSESVQTTATEGSNEEEQVTDTIDNPEQFLEQNCLFDLDGDGYGEPYIVTVHKQTSQVVRIVARYQVKGIIIKDEAGNIRKMGPDDRQNLDKLELVRIEPEQNIVAYEFIPSTDGTFLGIGYYHLLSSLSKAINSSTNQLMDSGALANLQGGFLAKGFRAKMGNLLTQPGKWQKTDISAQDLHAGILPYPFKDPSATLFALTQEHKSDIQGMTVSTDLKGILSPNAPATTTLALIQEAMMPMSAIMQRIITSESEEFKQLFILNSRFADPVQYRNIVDDPEANFKEDYNLENMDVIPTANPELSSKGQRLQRAEAMVSQAPNIALEGGDTRPLRDNWFEALGAEDMIGQVFPSIEDQTEEQKQRIQAQQKQAQRQQMLENIQVDLAERDMDMKELKTQTDADKVPSEIEKTESETLLNREKAESEDVKNQISKYTDQRNAVNDAIDNVIKEETFGNDQRLLAEPGGATTTPPNNQG